MSFFSKILELVSEIFENQKKKSKFGNLGISSFFKFFKIFDFRVLVPKIVEFEFEWFEFEFEKR